jgi:hypothetical protein
MARLDVPSELSSQNLTFFHPQFSTYILLWQLWLLSDGEIWTAHGGVNPYGLVVWRGDRELRTRWLC